MMIQRLRYSTSDADNGTMLPVLDLTDADKDPTSFRARLREAAHDGGFFYLVGHGVPRAQFQRHFTTARAAGLHSVPHSGESTGPQSVWDALTLLGAERIGHGTSSVQDPRLLEHLAEHGIPLEVCPTSNIATRVVERIEEHPIRAMRDAGVVVTVNSDDPPMFGTTLNREYEIAAGLLDLDEAGVADLAVAAVDASFAPDDVKTRLRAEIAAHATP